MAGRSCERELDCSAPTQVIRLVDVFLLGPAMVWVGLGARKAPVVGAFVAAAGVATIAFNGSRYLAARRPTPEVPGLGCTEYRGYSMCVVPDTTWKVPGSGVPKGGYVYRIDEGGPSSTVYATPALAAQGARDTLDDWES